MSARTFEDSGLGKTSLKTLLIMGALEICWEKMRTEKDKKDYWRARAMKIVRYWKKGNV